jgi:hypothetical protein
MNYSPRRRMIMMMVMMMIIIIIIIEALEEGGGGRIGGWDGGRIKIRIEKEEEKAILLWLASLGLKPGKFYACPWKQNITVYLSLFYDFYWHFIRINCIGFVFSLPLPYVLWFVIFPKWYNNNHNHDNCRLTVARPPNVQAISSLSSDSWLRTWSLGNCLSLS